MSIPLLACLCVPCLLACSTTPRHRDFVDSTTTTTWTANPVKSRPTSTRRNRVWLYGEWKGLRGHQHTHHQPGNQRTYLSRWENLLMVKGARGDFGGLAQVTSPKDRPLLSKHDEINVMLECYAGSLRRRYDLQLGLEKCSITNIVRSTDSNRIIIVILRSTPHNFANMQNVFLELAIAWIAKNHLHDRA